MIRIALGFFFLCLVGVIAKACLVPPVSAAPPEFVFTPLTCQYIPGTSTPVGAACLQRSQYPVVTNPQDPKASGADPTGQVDSSTAFSTALTAGNVYVGTPGTYLINTTLFPAAGRTIVCAPGVTLKNTLNNAGHTAIFEFASANVTVAGCDFQGGNTAPGAKNLGVGGGNFLILGDDTSNILIEGNTFENAWSNGAIQLETGSTGPGVTNSTVKFNTFSGNPYYGAVVTSGTGDTISNNLSIDSPMGVEGVCATEPIGTITVKNNMVAVLNGDCRKAGNGSCDQNVFITGGSTPSGCNYSTDIVKNNYLTGNSTQHANYEDDCGGCTAATYSNDINGPLSNCRSGAINC